MTTEYDDQIIEAREAGRFTELFDLLITRGVVYSDGMFYDLALRDANEAVELIEGENKGRIGITDNYENAYFLRGLVYEGLNEIDLALSSLEDAIAVNRVLNNGVETQKAAGILSQMATLQYAKGDTAEGDFSMSSAISIHRKSANEDDLRPMLYLLVSLKTRGKSYDTQNRLDDALLDYSEAIELIRSISMYINMMSNEGYKELLEWRASIYQRLGRQIEADKDLEEAKSISPL